MKSHGWPGMIDGRPIYSNDGRAEAKGQSSKSGLNVQTIFQISQILLAGGVHKRQSSFDVDKCDVKAGQNV
eukprot:scaffold9662_cov57-Cyclotella_meneghiniana.AAC.2